MAVFVTSVIVIDRRKLQRAAGPVSPPAAGLTKTASAAQAAPVDSGGGRKPPPKASEEDVQPVSANGAYENDTEAEILEAVATLQDELEATLYERMNPGALLAVAQLIADLDMDLTTMPVPTIDGGVRFEFEGMPEGINAALEVNRPTATSANILSLEVQCDEEGDGKYLEGAYRGRPSLRVKVWTDSDGKPLHMVMSSNLEPLYRKSVEAGLDINYSTINYGLSYHLDMKDGANSGTKALVMVNGIPTDKEVPAILGGAEPQVEQVKKFSSTLLALQKSQGKQSKEH
jgi:hypothetical protein